MSGSIPAPRFYSRFGNVVRSEANLPHWDQDGVTTFVTFRLSDSLPQERLLPFLDARDEWLKRHPQPWDEKTAGEYAAQFDGVAERWLDEGCGSCILGEAASRRFVSAAQKMEDSILVQSGETPLPRKWTFFPVQSGGTPLPPTPLPRS